MKKRSPGTRTGLRLSISASLGASAVPFLRIMLRRAWKLLDDPPQRLSVALVNDREMSALHRKFMGIRGPTDVLTFPLETDARGRVTEGEVVICVPEARRQAKKREIPLRRELLLYALHGVLHLCGFDDRTDAGFAAMHAKEDEILRRLGVGATFDPPARRVARRRAHFRHRATSAKARGAR